MRKTFLTLRHMLKMKKYVKGELKIEKMAKFEL